MDRLEFRNVTKRFGSMIAVEGVTLSVADGEVVSLIGPSGCGKSTLLNMGSGLDPASEGEVFVDGALVTRPNPHVAFMLQKDLLLPWRTIVENVELGQEIQGLAKSERRQRALPPLLSFGGSVQRFQYVAHGRPTARCEAAAHHGVVLLQGLLPCS